MIPQTRPSDPSVHAAFTSSGPPVPGRAVRLRAVEPRDRRTLVGFDRDPADDRSPRVGGYRHWAAHRTRTPDSGDDLQFAIETLRDGVLVGSVSTVQADAASDRFSYGIGIGLRHRRRGYATDAVTTLLALMFGQRGHRTCEVGIYEGNSASLALHAGLGFREEARFLDPDPAGGSRRLVLMTITAREFAVLHPDLVGVPAPGRGRHWRRARGRHWADRES